ncbi:hypothetical protein [Falsirhodobacter sp. alg1]|nr:hypothetical protein [Falsirhodobacter sp. alg1]
MTHEDYTRILRQAEADRAAYLRKLGKSFFRMLGRIRNMPTRPVSA